MADGISNRDMALLLQRCADEMNNEDGRRIAAGELHWHSVCSHPTVVGHEICDRVAKEMGVPEWGELAYYLLVHTWNDVLDWSRRVLEPEGTTDAPVP